MLVAQDRLRLVLKALFETTSIGFDAYLIEFFVMGFWDRHFSKGFLLPNNPSLYSRFRQKFPVIVVWWLFSLPIKNNNTES